MTQCEKEQKLKLGSLYRNKKNHFCLHISASPHHLKLQYKWKRAVFKQNTVGALLSLWLLDNR